MISVKAETIGLTGNQRKQTYLLKLVSKLTTKVDTLLQRPGLHDWEHQPASEIIQTVSELRT